MLGPARRDRRRPDDAAVSASRRSRSCCLPVAIWGWRLLTHRVFDRETTAASRSGSSAALLAAGFASCLPRQQSVAAADRARRRGRRRGAARAGLDASARRCPASPASPSRCSSAPWRFVALAFAAGFGLARRSRRRGRATRRSAPRRTKQPTTTKRRRRGREQRSLVSLGWLYHVLYSAAEPASAAASLRATSAARRRPRVAPRRATVARSA